MRVSDALCLLDFVPVLARPSPTTPTCYGSAEIDLAGSMREDFRPYRDELIISTKAGYDMWPGPLRRPRVHRKSTCWPASTSRWGGWALSTWTSSTRTASDPDTPLEETMGAPGHGGAVPARRSTRASRPTHRSGRARPTRSFRVDGYPAAHSPAVVLDDQPLDRGRAARHARRDSGSAAFAFSPLAQGVLTTKYLFGEHPRRVGTARRVPSQRSPWRRSIA